jgi:ATP-binding cassette subfamily B protein
MTQQDRQFTERANVWAFLRRLLRYATAHRRWFIAFLCTIICVGICDAIYPLIWKLYLDNYIVPQVQQHIAQHQAGDTPIINPMWLLSYGAMFLLNGTIQAICVYFFVKYAGFIQERVMYDLRRQMFVKLQSLSFSFFDKSAQGWLLSRLTSDTERVTELISWGLLECTWGLTMITACMSAMFFYNWKLALIVATTIPILVLLSFKISTVILLFSRQARKINSEITATYTEHVSGVETNKITAQEKRVSTEFSYLTNTLRSASFRSSFYTALYMPLVIFVGAVGGGIVLYVGGQMTLDAQGALTVGTLAAFFNYATQVFWPILDIAKFYGSTQHSLSAGERIFSLLDEQPSIVDRPNASDFDTIKGAITFEKVSFAYTRNKAVLHDINLHITAGTSVALVGATGGGKSTITNLVCRFYEPTEGIIKIDGEDYLNKTVHSLRNQLGVVLQTPHLFAGTVRNNIRYGRIDATDAEIVAALNLVGATQFVQRLDDEVGEAGGYLSMGERQLLSFARAILKQPRILIMDEATSAIDTLTEATIQKGIAAMLEGRTSLIIAHRLSTIEHCDRILVVKNGAIIEDGNHQTLLAKHGYYYDLYSKYAQQEFVEHYHSNET